MAHAEVGSSDGAHGSADRGANWPTAIASLCVGAGFLALWFWLLPGWLGFHGYASGVAGWRLVFVGSGGVGPGWQGEITPELDLVLTRTAPRPIRTAIGTEADPVLLEVFNNLFMSI